MDIIKVFKEEGISKEVYSSLLVREKTRGVVFDNKKNIALLFLRNLGHHQLPGGGKEANEDFRDCFVREMKEEIGCDIKDMHAIGVTLEVRAALGRINKTYCFVSKTNGEKGTPDLSKEEEQEGVEACWVAPMDALRILNEEVSQASEIYKKWSIARCAAIVEKVIDMQ